MQCMRRDQKAKKMYTVLIPPNKLHMSNLSPAYDNKIARKYSARTIEHKMENKLALQDELGWMQEPKQPIVCLPCGSTDALGGALMEQLLPGLLELPINIVIRGRGAKKYGELFTSLFKAHPHRIAIMQDDEQNMRKMLAGSDIAVFFAESDEDGERDNALRYGTIPVSLANVELENYNPVQETGNAFVFEEATHWQCFAALVRALETFKFPYDWRTIQRHAMNAMDKKENLQPA